MNPRLKLPSAKVTAAARAYSRLSLGRVLGDGDGEGGVGKLRRPGPRHHRQHGGDAAAAQAVGGHHRQQVLAVALQRKPRGPHVAALAVHLEATVATWTKEGCF